MEHDPELTLAYLSGKVDQAVKRRGRDTIVRNAERDPHARFARIPDGNACEFCRMLGSRGFVYHSERTAGGEEHGTRLDAYHPYCNCQVAVCFDPFIEEYHVGWTKVTRGYGDGQVAVPGRDGSDVLREVDIDELFAEYKAMGRDFTAGSRLKRTKGATRNLAGGARLPDDEFQAAMQRLADARTLDELHAVGDGIVRKWPANRHGRNPDQWNEMSRFAREREDALSHRDLTVESPYFDEKAGPDKSNAWTVNYRSIEAYAYRRKYDSMPYPRNVRDSLHKEAIEMLGERDGTNGERLVAVNARTGRRVASNYGDEAHAGWARFNDAEEAKARSCPDGIILLHNHPNSTYPSAADIVSCCERHALGSVVACHDGDVYLIRVNSRFFKYDGSRSELAVRYSQLLQEAKALTSDTNEAKNTALARLERENERRKWYVIERT